MVGKKIKQINNITITEKDNFYMAWSPQNVMLLRDSNISTYTKGEIGYLFSYKIDLSELNVLDLTSKDSLHWIAELLFNRELNLDNREAYMDIISDFITKYKLDTDSYDVIIGYRADDSYFTYATDFVTGGIYRDTLEEALRFGDLGLQVCIKSEKAFKLLTQITDPEIVGPKYAAYYLKRDKIAREKYREAKKQCRDKGTKKRITDFV